VGLGRLGPGAQLVAVSLSPEPSPPESHRFERLQQVLLQIVEIFDAC
jgi:hypothetical protein